MAESHSTFSEIGSPNHNQSLEQATENGALNGAVNGDDHGYSGSSLSMDFSAPLSGQARNERVKQMANNHVRPNKTFHVPFPLLQCESLQLEYE